MMTTTTKPDTEQQTTDGPLCPNVRVPLAGHDGNAFAILGHVQREMKRQGVPKEQIDEYRSQAMAGDYDNLIQVTMRWVVTS